MNEIKRTSERWEGEAPAGPSRETPWRGCDAFADRLVDLSDGELAGEERLAVEQHVEHCPGCAAELRRLDRSLTLLLSREQTSRSRLPGGTLPCESTLVSSSRSASARQTYRPGPGLVPAIGIGSLALAIVLLLAFGIWQSFRPTETDNVANVEPVSPPIAAAPPAAPTEAAVFRQIALIEEQARLQTWLDLMPREPEYADERAANEALLASLKGETL